MVGLFEASFSKNLQGRLTPTLIYYYYYRSSVSIRDGDITVR